MRQYVRLCAIAMLALVSLRATCGTRPETRELVPAIKITDNVYFHNMSITWDGSDYYTINGGNAEHCKLNQYDSAGEYLADYDVELDGRAIFYHPDDELFYVKDFGTDLQEVDADIEYFTTTHMEMFADSNSSPGFAPDGSRAYEMHKGRVRVLDMTTGEQAGTIKLAQYYREYGYNQAIAASDANLFVWGGENTVLVYTLQGRLVSRLDLPVPGFWASLSWCNNMLWVAEDADSGTEGGDGYWYGFKL